MKYTPRHAVWEITYGCNMRCKHCGSGCGERIPDELTTDEALALCGDLADLGLSVLTLSGGEPFLRKDWHLLARALTDRGVRTNAISNGWFIDDALVKKAMDAGILNIAVSIDGLRETHDYFRMKGSYDRVLSAFGTIRKNGLPSTACTNINKKNLPELPRIRDVLVERHVDRWQIQITRPMGNFSEHRDLVISPDEVCEIVDFAYEVMKEGKILVNLGDDIGYYGIKDTEVRKCYIRSEDPLCNWVGCQAGKSIVGIRANGEISACLSIRDDSFIEGSVRTTTLAEIWNRDGAFAFTRGMSKDTLTGFCARCQYANRCFAGCLGSRLTLCESKTENTHCVYRRVIEREAEKIRRMDDAAGCVRTALACVRQNAYQVADLLFARALELRPNDPYLIDMLGYTNFYLENYALCRQYNERALDINPNDAYAWKGLGLCLSRLGEAEKGIECIKKAIALAGENFTDYYFDLAVVLDENNRPEQAVQVLDQVRKHSESFRGFSQGFYDSLKRKIGTTSRDDSFSS